MPYSAPIVRPILSPDRPNRKVMLALEVIDPVAQALVSRGLTVTAKGLDRDPILSWSGRFVWLEEAGKWPDEIAIAGGRLPFASAVTIPDRPPRFPDATPAERLVRVTLRPTPAYEFPAGVTAVRGRLCLQITDPDVPAVPLGGARVQLAWFDSDIPGWVPPPPPSPRDAETDARGEFVAFARRPTLPAHTSDPDRVAGTIQVRLQVTRGGPNPETRATPEDFAFLPDPAARGRVVEGQLLPRDLKLGWAELRLL